MPTLAAWLDEYAESHQNRVNKTIHWICVPLITFSVLGMSWALSPWVALVVIAGAGIFYIGLSVPLALGMLVIAAVMLSIVAALPHPFWISLTIFVLAWIGQFYGHQVQGKKPSFFKDLQFLLVGPIWLLHFVYRRVGIPA
jgi:uncharacterized membrane protein YGL010W